MKNHRHTTGSLLGQLTLILGLVFLFALGGALTYYRTGGLSLPVAMVPVAVALCLAASLAGWIWLQRPDIRAWLYEKRWVLLLVVLLALVRLPQWNTPIQDDGYVYYSKLTAACGTFSFDPSYLFSRFRLANHPTWGLAMLAAIPTFFMQGSPNSFFVFQLAVSLASSACVYDLLYRHAVRKEGMAFLGALCFGCSPMFLGMVSYPSLEVGLSSFFICLLWAYSRRYYLLLLFTCVLTVTSKEFGIVLIFGFFVGAFLGELLGCSEPGIRRLWKVVTIPRIALFCVTGLCMGVGIIAYLFNPALSWFDLRTVFQDHSATHLGYVGWSWSYTLYKIQELIFVNFDWLLLLGILGCLVWRRVRHKAPITTESRTLMLGVGVAGVLYLMFSSLAVTYTLPRYSLVTELMLAFCAVMMLCQTVRIPLQRVGYLVLSALLAVQGYFCIDPVMKWWFPDVDTGGITMARVTQADGRHMGDYMVYNYQYSYLRRALRDIFSEYDPAEYDFVVLDRDGWYYLTYLQWDPATRTFRPGEENTTLPMPETVIPIREYQTDTTQGNSVDKAYGAGELQSKAIITWSPTYVENTPTVEQAREKIPDCYTHVEQHEWDGGLAGKVIYFTADLATEQGWNPL